MKSRSVAPTVPDMEVAVLGACLQDQKAAQLAAAKLLPGDFFDDGRRLIFSTIQRLVSDGTPVDRVTLKTAEDRIPATALLDLEEAVPSAVNAAYWIERVRTCGRSRTILDAGRRLVAHLQENGKDPDAHLRDFYELAGGEPGRQQARSGSPLPSLDAPVAVLRKLTNQGDPIPTGFKVLDDRLRGGLRSGKALVAGGTAGAGKTAFVIQGAKAAAEAGCVVACLLSDEGREPGIVRLGQQFGYERDALEAVDHPAHETALAGLERDLASLDIFFPDPDADADTTLEGVVEAVVTAYPTRQKLVVVDSIQTVRTRQSVRDVPSIRERIMGNARIARRLAVEHGLCVLYTSEVNRSWYRARKEEDRASDLAAFAEARIEFSADVLLTMRAMDEDPDLVEVRIPKNRLGPRQGFMLRLDRSRARLDELDSDPREAVRNDAQSRAVDDVKAKILRALQKTSDLTRTQVYQVVGGKKTVFNAALDELKDAGLVECRPYRQSMLHRLAEAKT